MPILKFSRSEDGTITYYRDGEPLMSVKLPPDVTRQEINEFVKVMPNQGRPYRREERMFICENCDYWYQLEDKPGVGECRVNAPTADGIQIKTSSKYWCGRYLAAPRVY